MGGTRGRESMKKPESKSAEFASEFGRQEKRRENNKRRQSGQVRPPKKDGGSIHDQKNLQRLCTSKKHTPRFNSGKKRTGGGGSGSDSTM